MLCERIADAAPLSGRRDTLVHALELLHERKPEGAVLVEIGTTRSAQPRAQRLDGWATRLFAWYARETAGRVIAVDPTLEAIEAAKRVCGDLQPHVEFVAERGEVWAQGYRGDVDLLYLDGPNQAQAHLDVYEHLRDQPLVVVVDDVIDEQYGPKGRLVVPHLLERGYEMSRLTIGPGGQAVLVRSET